MMMSSCNRPIVHSLHYLYTTAPSLYDVSEYMYLFKCNLCTHIICSHQRRADSFMPHLSSFTCPHYRIARAHPYPTYTSAHPSSPYNSTLEHDGCSLSSETLPTLVSTRPMSKYSRRRAHIAICPLPHLCASDGCLGQKQNP